MIRKYQEKLVVPVISKQFRHFCGFSLWNKSYWLMQLILLLGNFLVWFSSVVLRPCVAIRWNILSGCSWDFYSAVSKSHLLELQIHKRFKDMLFWVQKKCKNANSTESVLLWWLLIFLLIFLEFFSSYLWV